MKINIKYLGIIILVFVWLILFFDNYGSHNGIVVLIATSRVFAFASAYNVHKYFFPRLKKSRKARWLLFISFMALSTIMFVVEVFLEEPYFEGDNKTSEVLGVCMDKDDRVNIHTITDPKEFWIEALFVLFLSSIQIAIAMALSWTAQLMELNRKNQMAILEMESMSKESELNELKNQLNPHFLFNALSNIYSLAYLGDKETPNKIMQLSKMLRYVIYETDVKEISIEREIDYIKHYIDFQDLKSGGNQQVEFDYSECETSVKVAPLVLLPFIENAFKHSQILIEKDAWIKIKLRTDQNTLHFSVDNTISTKNKPEILNNKGVGLENQQKRLELIYGEGQRLNVKRKVVNEQEVYCVELQIKRV